MCHYCVATFNAWKLPSLPALFGVVLASNCMEQACAYEQKGSSEWVHCLLPWHRHVASSRRTFALLLLSSAMYTTRQLSSSSTAEKDDALKAISKVLLCSLDGKGAQMGMALPSIHHPLVSRA